MGISERHNLSEASIAAARDLFERIVAAEADMLTDEQKADPRAYLLAVWREAAFEVTRPLREAAPASEEDLAVPF